MAQLATSAKVNLAKASEALKVAVASKQAEGQKLAKQAAIVSTSIATVAASSPAFALVESNYAVTEGTALPLGIDDPLLFWLALGTFGAVWAVWL